MKKLYSNSIEALVVYRNGQPVKQSGAIMTKSQFAELVKSVTGFYSEVSDEEIVEHNREAIFNSYKDVGATDAEAYEYMLKHDDAQ